MALFKNTKVGDFFITRKDYMTSKGTLLTIVTGKSTNEITTFSVWHGHHGHNERLKPRMATLLAPSCKYTRIGIK